MPHSKECLGRCSSTPWTDHWAIGDRVAWGELLSAARFAQVKHLPRLLPPLPHYRSTRPLPSSFTAI